MVPALPFPWRFFDRWGPTSLLSPNSFGGERASHLICILSGISVQNIIMKFKPEKEQKMRFEGGGSPLIGPVLDGLVSREDNAAAGHGNCRQFSPFEDLLCVS